MLKGNKNFSIYREVWSISSDLFGWRTKGEIRLTVMLFKYKFKKNKTKTKQFFQSLGFDFFQWQLESFNSGNFSGRSLSPGASSGVSQGSGSGPVPDYDGSRDITDALCNFSIKDVHFANKKWTKIRQIGAGAFGTVSWFTSRGFLKFDVRGSVCGRAIMAWSIKIEFHFLSQSILQLKCQPWKNHTIYSNRYIQKHIYKFVLL